jgi:two-component system CheB/CheR fusion protein
MTTEDDGALPGDQREVVVTSAQPHQPTVNRTLTDALEQLRAQSDELRLAAVAAQVAATEIETLNAEALASVEDLRVANEHLAAMAALHRAEQFRLAAVLASMGDAVVVVDDAGQLVLTNAAYDDLVQSLGGRLQPADEYGEPLPLDATPQVRAAQGETFRIDFTATTAEGVHRWFEATGRPLREGDIGAGVVVIRDISDRSVRILQGEFLAWAAHEMRTPLTLFKGYLQMAEQRVGPDGDARLLHYLNRASHQIQQQSVLVEELLDATRLETGRLSLRTETVDVAALATHVVEVIQILAQGQTITLDADDGVFVVAGDAGRLEQVLLNLLTNAIAYAPGTERIDVAVRCEGGDALITVRDFGPGIEAKKMTKIFTRYVQGSQAERSGTRGLGLGLYIAREIVHAHGGTITVASVPGEGSTFTMRLPLSGDAMVSSDVPAAILSTEPLT